MLLVGAPRKDITGTRVHSDFGYVECVGLSHYRDRSDGHRRPVWIWRCSLCGRERALPYGDIKRQANVNYCCASNGIEQRYMVRLHYSYMRTKRSHLKHGGTEENFISFPSYVQKVTSTCAYCGCPPDTPVKETWSKDPDLTLGHRLTLDRVNSELPYTDENTVPSCYTCNVMKSDMTVEDFEEHIKKVHSHFTCGCKN